MQPILWVCSALTVRNMNYFRHAPLALWALVLGCLVALGFVGWATAASGTPTDLGVSVQSQAPDPAPELLFAEASGVHAAIAAGQHQAWAEAFLVRAVVARETARSMGASPSVVLKWDRVVAATQRLAEYRGDDPVRLHALGTEMGTAVASLATAQRLR